MVLKKILKKKQPKLPRRRPSFPGNQLHHHEPKFVEKIAPYLGFLQTYFRYKAVGTEKIPKGRASLVVMNHGIIPYHGFLFTKWLVEKRKIYPRGLGAAFLFTIPFVKEFFLKGGAVNASPRNGEELLRQGNCVLLAPGGIYEGLVCYPGMKRIPWERRQGFIQLAIRTGTPIIPTFCGGINDVYYNSKFLLKARIKILEATRFSLPLFFGIGLLPLPVKLVHSVGNPIATKRLKGETEKRQVARLHQEVIDEMKRLEGLENAVKKPKKSSPGLLRLANGGRLP